MGTEWIVNTLQALQAAGIRAQRGFPTEKMPYLTGPVVGISVEQIKEDAVTLAVRVYAPVTQGGPVCEDMAARVMEVLNQLKAQCTVESGSFDGSTGLFCVPVKAKFAQVEPAPEIEVYIDEVKIKNMVSITARYWSAFEGFSDLTTQRPYLHRMEYGWVYEIEDLLEPGALPCNHKDPFIMYIRHAGGTLTYGLCYYESVHIIPTAAGSRRVRRIVTCNDPTENIPM